jgi:sarcosine oxidase subunit gamma
MMARTPLDGLTAPVGLGLTQAPDMARYILRGREAAFALVEEVLGFALPREACRAAGAEGRHALWLGPDEWLLLAPVEARLDRTLAFAIGDLPYSLVEVSQRQLGLELEGAHAAATLNVGCPLDLDLAAFPVGMCTRTLVAKAEVVLWRTGETSFHIEVWRSFSSYLWQYLVLSGAEFV